MNEQRRNFLATISGNREGGFINLDMVRMVDRIGPGHIRLWFSETHMMEINGDGAAGVLARIVERSIALDGSPVTVGIPNIASVIKSES